MKAFLKELKFPSTKRTYIKNITDEVSRAIKKAQVENGICLVSTKHTTLGIILQEIAEPNLLEDFLHHSLEHVHEDKRSTKVTRDYSHPICDYKHRCQDNPYCNEIDEDYNAASHIRAMMYSHPTIAVPIRNGKLDLGKYQEVAVFEFDGRDGKGKNPIRQRTVQIWIYPAEEIEEI